VFCFLPEFFSVEARFLSTIRVVELLFLSGRFGGGYLSPILVKLWRLVFVFFLSLSFVFGRKAQI
jgi:hypothetical protein